MALRRILPVLSLLFGLSLTLGATARAALPEGVTETSYSTTDGERVLELSCEVPAGVQEVWNAWVSAEGFRSWAAPFAHVDLRVGGAIESSYDPKGKAGDPGNIRNEFVALVPLRLFVIRNTQAPAQVPFDAPSFQKTVTAVLLTPLGDSKTRVTVTNSGYRAGPEWDTTYAFFQQGNAWTLSQLRKRFETGPTDWAKVFAPQTAPKK